MGGSPAKSGAVDEEVPVACTLDAAAMPGRLSEWRAMLGHVRSRTTTADGARLEFAEGVDVGELARLAAAEQRCCGFFAFAITVDRRGVALEVRAPEAATEVVAALFG